MTKYVIGQPLSRFEDPRLLRGRGRYQEIYSISVG